MLITGEANKWTLSNHKHSGPFYYCKERPNLVPLSAYQEYLMLFKFTMSQVVQRARPLVGAERVNKTEIAVFMKPCLVHITTTVYAQHKDSTWFDLAKPTN